MPNSNSENFIFWKVLLMVCSVLLSFSASFRLPTDEGGVASVIFGLLIIIIPISVVIAYIIKWVFEFRMKLKKNAPQNDFSASVSSDKRIWKWYLILALAYYSIKPIIGFLTGYEIIDTGGANMDYISNILIMWPYFDIAVFVAMLTNKTEKVALSLPLLSFPHLIPFSGFFSPLDSIGLGIVIYLISRK